MKKKTEIAVKITDKNREKVREILEMFPFWKDYNCTEFKYIHYDRHCWVGVNETDKTLVKPKELRNILARDHVNAGDIVVLKYKDQERVCSIHLYDMENYIYGGSSNDVRDKKTFGVFKGYFLRYATEEEKALLEPASITYKGKPVKIVCGSEEVEEDVWEINFTVKQEPKKELEVGRWYKVKDIDYDLELLGNYQGKEEYFNYGFNFKGNWSENLSIYHKELGVNMQEATPKEVEEALIKEAKSRGVKGGFMFDDRTNILWNQQENGNEIAILSNGKWSEIVNTKPNVINMYRLVKGSKCVRQFDEKQKDSLINNGWKEVTQQELIDLLFKK